MRDYHINVYFSEEDGEYIADIPDLKGCSASGATPEEAVREVGVAKGLWLESVRERGGAAPAPRYRPAIYLAG